MTVLIPNLALGHYKSFGTLQYFPRFTKITLLIGQNNSGKSNVLSLISGVYPNISSDVRLSINTLERHNSDPRNSILVGLGESPNLDSQLTRRFLSNPPNPELKSRATNCLYRVLEAKRKVDGTEQFWSIIALPNRSYDLAPWQAVLQQFSDPDLYDLWRMFTGMGGGGRTNWIPELAQRLQSPFPRVDATLVPAIRKIGDKGSAPKDFDGNGIIERLARLQNPAVQDQQDRVKFTQIRDFLRTVIDNHGAEIEVPYERDTINIHLDGRVLPISSLGTGIHEVLILATAATVLTHHVICIEEPELHLNPNLQRKLIRYLLEKTRNQYFIATHSPALMDSREVEIYHIRLVNGESKVEQVTSDNQRSAVCEDLGYHPSDLLQANCIIWVEGPSDRIYLKWWLEAIEDSLVEGIHFSIMFYGGKLAAHVSNLDLDEGLKEFISLRRLNRRSAIIIDSDRSNSKGCINATKKRLITEFDSGPGFAWVTAGREIENYIPQAYIVQALEAVAPRARVTSHLGRRFDHVLAMKGPQGKPAHAPKIEVARHISSHFEPDLSILDLKNQLTRLVAFIQASNPKNGTTGVQGGK